MQKRQLIWNTEPAMEIEIHQDRTSPDFSCSAVPARHRPLRAALPTLPRRQSCLTKRAMLAALREAELADWQASGGDTLRHLQSY